MNNIIKPLGKECIDDFEPQDADWFNGICIGI
jgi:hypothetical protein